jgi:hypothetical protein
VHQMTIKKDFNQVEILLQAIHDLNLEIDWKTEWAQSRHWAVDNEYLLAMNSLIATRDGLLDHYKDLCNNERAS